MVISPQSLTAEFFRPFGSVIEAGAGPAELINDGRTRKFADLARIEVLDGQPVSLHRYESQPVELPFLLARLECHPLGSQAFMPLHDRPVPLVVAPAGEPPRADNIKAFITNGQQGFCLNPGVWHHDQLSLGRPSAYLVIDRLGAGDNLQVVSLDKELWLQL